MKNETCYLAQHLLDAGVSPISGSDRRVLERAAHGIYAARNLYRFLGQEPDGRLVSDAARSALRAA